MEFLNVVRLLKRQKMRLVNDGDNTALYIIKIYCKQCGNECKKDDDSCSLEFDLVLLNDSTHLDYMK